LLTASLKQQRDTYPRYPNRLTKFLDAYNASIPNYTTGVRYTDRLSKPPRVPPPRWSLPPSPSRTSQRLRACILGTISDGTVGLPGFLPCALVLCNSTFPGRFVLSA